MRKEKRQSLGNWLYKLAANKLTYGVNWGQENQGKAKMVKLKQKAKINGKDEIVNIIAESTMDKSTTEVTETKPNYKPNIPSKYPGA